MKKILKCVLSILISASLLSVSFFDIISYADEIEYDDYYALLGQYSWLFDDDLDASNASEYYSMLQSDPSYGVNNFINYLSKKSGSFRSLLIHLGGVVGAYFGSDSDSCEAVVNDVFDILSPETVELSVDTDNIGNSTFTFSKTITDTLISSLETVTEETDGYTLIPTVKASKISSLMLYNGSKDLAILYDLMYDNDGAVGLYYNSSYHRTVFFPVDLSNIFWVKNSGSTTIDGVCYYSAVSYDTVYSKHSTYGYYCNDYSNLPTTWDSDSLVSYTVSGNAFSTSFFSLYDIFSAFYDYYGADTVLSKTYYIVTTTGASIPVFDSLDAAVDYSVANNLYYTSSSFTGEGTDITITLDDLSTILDGYYDDMYDYLQQLIQEEGVTLNPEQLQTFVDAVAEAYGLIADATNAQTEIINNGFSGLISATENQTDVIEDGFNDIASYLSDIKDILEDSSSSSTGGEVTLDEEQLREILNAVGSSSDTVADVISAQTDVIDSGLSDVAESIDELKEIVSNLTLSSDSDGEVTLDEEQLQEILDAVNESYSLVVDATTEQTGILSDIRDILDDILSQLKKIKNWTIADTVTDAADAVADWAEFITDFFSDIGAGVATVASGLSDTAGKLKGKFPFSIPWDIAFLIGFLAEEPEAPVFEIPLYIESFGINETIVFDFAQFEVLSKISRLLLTMLFCIGLLKLTEKVINIKKE